MRAPLAPLLALALALGIAASCTSRLLIRPPPEPVRDAQTDRWLEQIAQHAEHGDWLVTRGYALMSDVVVAATNRPWSHAAVLDKTHHQVIEATGEGVHTVPLPKFVHDAHRVMIVRPKWWTPERGAEAVANAHAVIGSNYDFLGLVGLGSNADYYCSELGVYAYHPWHAPNEDFPAVIDPGGMFIWGEIVHDTGERKGSTDLIPEL